MSSRLTITTISLIIAIPVFAWFFVTHFIQPPTPVGVPNTQNALSSSATSSSITVSTSSVTLANYRSKTFPLSFQYPSNWIVEDTMGGVTITSYKSDTGASIGTVPEGGFKIDLGPFNKSTKPLEVWCREPLEQEKFNKVMHLVISTSTEVFGRHDKVVAFDFTSQRDPTYNARVVCLEDNETYIAIDGYPLTASQLPLLNVIVNSVKADHDGRKFESGN
jgi:hypothetical protein